MRRKSDGEKIQGPVTAAGLGLEIGGALSNALDRLRLGSVRDFIDIYWGDWHWLPFNLADAAIFTGLAIVILSQDDIHAMKPANHRAEQ